MAVCDTDPVVNPPVLPPSGITAPNGPFPPQIFPNVGMPDLSAIYNALSLLTPPGTFKPNLSPEYSRSILDGIISLLEKFQPFLYSYLFFLPVLNIILCIIEVLCALKNPFKLAKAIRRLFRQCIPDFLRMFPQFALLVMIISILLLILLLIEYIISEVAKTLAIIQENIKLLQKATQDADTDVINAVTKKIGYLLCELQNILLILQPFTVIIDIYKLILEKAFRIPPCSSSAEDSCCDTEVCPAYLQPDTHTGTTGKLQYYNELAQDSGFIMPAGFPAFVNQVRAESWQFYDLEQTIQEAFWNITHAYDLPTGFDKVFFPTGLVYNASSDPTQVPYTLDLRIYYKPLDFGRVDSLGNRWVKVNKCIITAAPTNYYSDWENAPQTVTQGVLRPVGGLAYEDDGVTPLLIDGAQATLNTLIHIAPVISSIPVPTEADGYTIDGYYTLNINHEVLFDQNLIVLGCLPDVKFDKDFIDTTTTANLSSINSLLSTLVLPDVGAANICLQNALTAYATGVNFESTAVFEAQINSCLNILKTDSVQALDILITASTDYNNSDFIVDPELQFVEEVIKLKITLKDANNNLISANLTNDVANLLIPKFKILNSFGELSTLTYNSTTGEFIADISSDVAGVGVVTVEFNGRTFTITTIPTDLSVDPTVSEKSRSYEFISTESELADGKPRRDTSDMANNTIFGVS